MSEKVKIPCGPCYGTGHNTDQDVEGKKVEVVCVFCGGKGYCEYEVWEEK